MTPAETLTAISKQLHDLVEAASLFSQHLDAGVIGGGHSPDSPRGNERRAGTVSRRILPSNLIPDRLQRWRSSRVIHFLNLANRSLCLVVCLRTGTGASRLPHTDLSIVQIPAQVTPRYLEHPRIFFFQIGGKPVYLLTSADSMPRNLDRRVEIALPVLDPGLQTRLKQSLQTQLADDVKGRWMQSDGSYNRPSSTGSFRLRSQERLYEILVDG